MLSREVNECKPLILGKLGETDASGNPVLQNFAKYIKKDILEKMPDLKCDIKYIDPTYM